MDGKTHRLGGIASSVVTGAILVAMENPLDLFSAGLLIQGGAFGGIIADIDHPGSIVSRKLPWLSKIVTSFTKHRGITHTLLTSIVLTGGLSALTTLLPEPLRYYAMFWIIGVFVGYLSHLCLDMITRAGVKLLYPISNYSFRIASLNEKDHKEIVRFVVVIVSAAILVYMFKSGDIGPNDLSAITKNTSIAISDGFKSFRM